MDLELTDKRAIVIGASRGIGFSIAETLLAEGAHVVICGRTAADVERAVKDLSTTSPHVTGDVVDVGDADAFRTFLREAIGRLGGVDVLVHNVSAGKGEGDEGWFENLEVDVLGLVRAAQVVGPVMKEQGSGAIVCISSIAAQEEFPGPNSFGPLKAAMTVHANNLAHEMAPHGVRVNIVSPGPVRFEGGSWERAEQVAPERYRAVLDRMPIGRLGRAQEIADIVAFLASPRASLVVAANVVADGGFTQRVKF